MFSHPFLAIAAALLFCREVSAQTYSSCNPLNSASCPADTALGKDISIDFTKGQVNSFAATGGAPTYGSDGVSFTVAKSGDAPTLTSLFYIMFGKVEITMKAAPGAGIVSTLVLQSDDLDEIDMEWLGADGSEVQTNYFGKGDVTTYNRGQFNPAANNQGEFITYTVEWTQSQITWSVGSTIVRVLTPATADANQYPQTPMQIKFGAWSGGDPSNAEGTIQWARGPTNYANGPYTLVVQSLVVDDYSTGTQYKYGDTSGSWQSIQAVGGTINGNAGGESASVVSADVPAATSASPSIPAGWPWVAMPTTLTTSANPYATSTGIPSGWVITSSGKVVPASSAAASAAESTSSYFSPPSPSSSAPSSPDSPGLELSTGWNEQGFPTTATYPAGYATASKSYDQQGFLITGSPTTAGTPAATATPNLGAEGASAGTFAEKDTSRAGRSRSQLLRAWHEIVGVASVVAIVAAFL